MDDITSAVKAFREEALKLPRNANGKLDGRKTNAIINRIVRQARLDGRDYNAIRNRLWAEELDIKAPD